LQSIDGGIIGDYILEKQNWVFQSFEGIEGIEVRYGIATQKSE
jgi:hypothetical protein